MLPSPSSLRFQPLRSGLINLFKYQDQEFWYERGRLLIRGNNGTGKSRVLALQLPFLLDGEISPARVEPDGDSARQIAWHLLMDEYEQRSGYTWIEFGRRDESGTDHFVTLGCGMRAIRGGDNQPTRWFFITERRVRDSFHLVENSHPVSMDRLEEDLGKESIFKTVRDYRVAVDRRLFSLGEERYKGLMDLLIRLRAPQLGQKLDPGPLFMALSDALPPLSSSVVEKVATAFRDLDDLRQQFASLRELSQALVAFQSGYQGYLQATLLRRAAELRSRHSDFEQAQRKVAQIERDIEAATTAEEQARSALKTAKDNFDLADARLEALRQDPLADAADKLDQAKKLADAERRNADKAEQDAVEVGDRLEQITIDLELHKVRQTSCGASLEKACAEALQLASLAGFHSEHCLKIPSASSWPPELGRFDSLKAGHDKAAKDHLYRLEQIDSALKNLSRLQHDLNTEQEKESRVFHTIEEHREAASGHDKAARLALQTLAAEYALWRSSLSWLALPAWSDLASEFDDWIETAQESHRVLARSLIDAVGLEKSLHAAACEDVKSRQRVLASRHAELEGEKTLLSSGSLPPGCPPTRDTSSRLVRLGAPLWQVCEFRPHLASEERATLEAALEAAGILDAWISPDGRIVGDFPYDTFLDSSLKESSYSGPTLIDWLQPDLPINGSSPSNLSSESIHAALLQIAAGDAGAMHWVALDGHWRLGPLFGRGHKQQAVYLGSTSREAARQRRLAEIELELDGLSLQQKGLDVEVVELSKRAAEAEAERRSAPTDSEIERCLTLRTDARCKVNEAEKVHAAAVQATHRARQAAQDAESQLKRDARDLGYGDHLHRLTELRASWDLYDRALIQLWADARAWITETMHVEQLLGRERASREDKSRKDLEAEKARSVSLRAAEQHRTLAVTQGASIEEYQRQLETARSARISAQNAWEDFGTALQRATLALVGQRAALEPANEKVVETDKNRQVTIKALRLPLLYGLFPEAHPSLADIESDVWAPTRAYQIALRLNKELPAIDLGDNAWTDRLNRLNSQINDLRTRTGALGCQVFSQYLGDGLSMVTCQYQGSSLTPAQCLMAVEHERDTHQRLLGEREREIIDRHLITEVSMQLQSLMENARQRTVEMNQEMTQCATTLGVALRLEWEPVSEGVPAGLPHVRKLLLADHATWTDQERDTVGRFLHQLIQEERMLNPTASAAEQLLRALDYRRWHSYHALRRQNDRWERLTRKRYGTGSVGEKALMLTIPRMAAASSFYLTAAPHAPRLILLDEAFVGMDRPTRAKCMGLLEAFELGLLMTSEREWGTHATVSGIAIYQLVADSEAVAATRWVWNGSKAELAPVPDTPEGRDSTPAYS